MSDAQPSIPGILILRPTEQAGETIRLVRQHGWHAIHFPTVEIIPADPQQNTALYSSLKSFDWIIFISQNAVKHFVEQLTTPPDQMPKIATVGKASTTAAQKAGLKVNTQPDTTFSSEGLLETAEFQQVENQKILIVRGNGGRELLAETLELRGANVSYANVYERQLPDIDPSRLIQNWSSDITVILATSNQLLDNLVTLVGDDLGVHLYQMPVIVISKRMQQHAAQLGFDKIWLADGPTNDQMIEAIETNISPN